MAPKHTYNIICIIKSSERGMRENKQPNGLKHSQRFLRGPKFTFANSSFKTDKTTLRGFVDFRTLIIVH